VCTLLFAMCCHVWCHHGAAVLLLCVSPRLQSLKMVRSHLMLLTASMY
jgi:hypothetical protein